MPVFLATSHVLKSLVTFFDHKMKCANTLIDYNYNFSSTTLTFTLH